MSVKNTGAFPLMGFRDSELCIQVMQLPPVTPNKEHLWGFERKRAICILACKHSGIQGVGW